MSGSRSQQQHTSQQGSLFPPAGMLAANEATLADVEPIVVAEVVVEAPLGQLSYSVPKALQADLQIGCRVFVPMRARRLGGYVLAIEQRAALAQQSNNKAWRLKAILGIDHQAVRLPADLLHTMLFAANYYHVPAGVLLQQAVPTAMKRRPGRFRYVAKATAEHAQLTPLQQEICAILRQRSSSLATLRKRLGEEPASLQLALKQLLELGVIASQEPQRLRAKAAALTAPISQSNQLPSAIEPIQLSAEQTVASDAIAQALHKPTFTAFLLEGVTGSGKTQVYLQAISQALALGKQALLLVPEIALTGQLAHTCKQRFGEQVVTIHSGMADGERQQAWQAMATGVAKVAIGARSALFLPAQHLGLLIVDEEHESSYKQDTQPCYNGRDLALIRGQASKAVVVLGSATPALESHYQAERGKYIQLTMSKRIFNRALPQVQLISSLEHPGLQGTILSEPLLSQMEQTFARGEQAILYLNRRGYAPAMQCQACGEGFTCPQCAIHLTLYHKQRCLRCHYCNFERPEPTTCSHCHSPTLTCSGVGLERLEQQISQFFPASKCLRLDSEVAPTSSKVAAILQRFARKEANLLLGTQMITKGHNFPEVTLVGVVAADASLHFPDFRAAERTFQVLTQVSGRAGRGTKAGRVILQTMQPEHYALTTAANHDSAAFRQIELPIRQELHYPPFAHLALLCCSGPQESQVEATANGISQQLQYWAQRQANLGQMAILGPTPAPYARLQGKWRYHVLLKASKRATLHRLITLGQQQALAHKHVQQRWDIDPMHML